MESVAPSLAALTRRLARCLRQPGAWACALAWWAIGPAQAQCTDEDRADPVAAVVAPGDAEQARSTLREMVREALARSQQADAAQLVAEAALDDVAEVRAAKRISAGAGAGVGPGGTRSLAGTETSALQLRASVSASQLLYDAGRLDRLIDWRTQMAESARFGQLSVQEQLALSTVSLALERSRWRQQAVVYGQYVRKMGCLVQALQTIVRADRGRASELVQAQKTLQQADMALAQAQSQVRQVETRLRRLVGDGLPGTDGLAALLREVPALPQLHEAAERHPEVSALAAQARALAHYEQAVRAGGKPQVSWSVSASHALGLGGSRGTTNNGNFAVGVAVNVPLLVPGLEPASQAAAKRTRAAELQRQEALEARRWRITELHEQTLSSFDRAQRVGTVLRDSDQLRGFTLQQWQQLGRRSLFDVMAAEAEHYNLRVSWVNAVHDGQQLNANLLSLGGGVTEWLK